MFVLREREREKERESERECVRSVGGNISCSCFCSLNVVCVRESARDNVCACVHLAGPCLTLVYEICQYVCVCMCLCGKIVGVRSVGWSMFCSCIGSVWVRVYVCVCVCVCVLVCVSALN